MPGAPLVPRAGRRPAMLVVGFAAVIFLALAAWLHGMHATGIDNRISRWIDRHAQAPWVVSALTDLTAPAVDIAVLAVVALTAAVMRRWRVVALAVAGPGLALLASEQVFKPLIHRPHSGPSYPVVDAFPSGHETGLVGTLTVVALLLVRTRWHWLIKTALLVVLGAWAVLGAAGLVRISAHYPTDTAGAVCVAVAVVLSTALLLDAVFGRLERRVSGPAAPDPPRRAHVA